MLLLQDGIAGGLKARLTAKPDTMQVAQMDKEHAD